MAMTSTNAIEDSIAIVIVNYNGASFLGSCLSAVMEQSVKPERVIVVDNASTDSSITIVESDFPDVEIVRLSQNTGFAAANNNAFSLIKDCQWVALLNPDTVAYPNWICLLKQAINKYRDTSVFSCRLEDMNNPSKLDGTGDQYHVTGLSWRRDHGASTSINRSVEEGVFSPCAAAALYRLDDVVSVGMFDESYFCYNEDTDLMFRMRLKGKHCLHLDHCVVRHAGSGITGTQSDFSVYYGHRNLVWTYFKNMPPFLLWLYLPQHILLNLVTIIYFTLKGRFRVIVRAKWHALCGLPRILRMRESIHKSDNVSHAVVANSMIRNPLAAYFNRYEK